MSMTTIISSTTGGTVNIGAVGRIPYGSAELLSFSEANAQVPIYSNGVVRNLRVSVSALGAGTTHTVRVRINGADGNLNLTITGTGVFTDTTNSDIIRSGDLVNYVVTRATGGGTVTLTLVSTEFDNDDNVNISGGTTAISVNWPTGNNATGMGQFASTNNNHRSFARTNTILKNLTVRVHANTLNAGNTYVFPLLETTAIINLALIPDFRVTIPAGSTGTFTDTSNIFTLTINNRYWFQYWREGSTTGNINFSYFMVHEVLEDSRVTFHTGRGLSAILATNNSKIPMMGTYVNNQQSDALTQVRIPQDCVLFATNVRLGISANSRTADCKLIFRVNGVNTDIEATIPGGSTANIIGTGGPVYLQAGDLVNYIFDTGGVGTQTVFIRIINTLLTIDKFEPWQT